MKLGMRAILAILVMGATLQCFAAPFPSSSEDGRKHLAIEETKGMALDFHELAALENSENSELESTQSGSEDMILILIGSIALSLLITS